MTYRQVQLLVEEEAPKHLRELADWIDVKYPKDKDPEVQECLRRWASVIEDPVSLEIDSCRRMSVMECSEEKPCWKHELI